MRSSRRRGFTLVELVVALAVGASALSVGYAALGTLVDQRRAVDAATRETARAVSLRSHIAELIAGATTDVRGERPFRGVDAMRDGDADDALTFLTVARTPLGDGPAVVRLFIARDAAGRVLGLAADYTAWHGADRLSAVLDSTVRGLDVQYRASAATDGPWESRWLQPTALPAGVRVRLSAARRDSLSALERTAIVVATEGAR